MRNRRFRPWAKYVVVAVTIIAILSLFGWVGAADRDAIDFGKGVILAWCSLAITVGGLLLYDYFK